MAKEARKRPFSGTNELILSSGPHLAKSGTRNRFTQSKYRLGPADGFPVHHSSPVASKCDFWTKLLTKAEVGGIRFLCGLEKARGPHYERAVLEGIAADEVIVEHAHFGSALRGRVFAAPAA